jgi:hypothetical protein
MTTPDPKKPGFPFSPTLMAVELAALTALGVCVAELFPKQGKPLGLIPADLVLPVLLAAVVVAVICGYMQIRTLLDRHSATRDRFTHQQPRDRLP